MPRKWSRKRGEEDRNCDEGEWEKNGEEQKIEGTLETIDRERSVRKVMKEKRKKKTTETEIMANLTAEV